MSSESSNLLGQASLKHMNMVNVLMQKSCGFPWWQNFGVPPRAWAPHCHLSVPPFDIPTQYSLRVA